MQTTPSPLAAAAGAVFLSPTHLNTLLNCAKSIKHATQIHAQIITRSYTFLPFLFNNLINLYAKCGHINQSLALFSATHDEFRNVVTWTSLITQLSRCNKPFLGFTFFNKMRTTGIQPNQFTFSAILAACADTSAVVHGEQIHSLVCRHGYGSNIFVASALADMYAKCSDMSSAEKVFDGMPERNLVSWNSMIVGNLRNKMYNRAVSLFTEILRENLSPDQVSFSSVLSACASIGCVHYGMQVHGVIVKFGLVSLAFVKNSLMDMYCKCGIFEHAIKLFRTINDRDVVTWNIMVMGFVQNDNFEEACNYFWVMRREGVSPDEASFSTALHAAANLAAIDQGMLMHNQVIKTGFVKNTCVSNSLIVMYAKCGSLVDSHQVFDETEDKNVVSWTSMISAYQQHGCSNRAIELFHEMLREGIKPEYITFISVLSACGHTGHVQEGLSYFTSMAETYGVNPGPEHYACVVDMFGRAGRLREAKKFAESMKMKPDASVWGALLCACRNHGNLEMGREVAEILFEIEPYNPGNYVLLSNMYARSGRIQEANELRRVMGVNGVRKEPGCSWIELKNDTSVFTAHDRSHSWTNEIYDMLGKLEDSAKEEETYG